MAGFFHVYPAVHRSDPGVTRIIIIRFMYLLPLLHKSDPQSDASNWTADYLIFFSQFFTKMLILNTFLLVWSIPEIFMVLVHYILALIFNML